jgi:hypothetical protein
MKREGKARVEGLGKVMNILLPSVKMKSFSPRGEVFEQEWHEFLLKHFSGYTVTSGSITGYWQRDGGREECNEHREYQIAVRPRDGRKILERYVANLARELGEESVYVTFDGEALLISGQADKGKNPAFEHTR